MDIKTNNVKEVEFSTFYIGDVLFGINILDIQEINKHFEITRVPQAEDYIEGILNLRGRIVTIIDLGKKIGFQSVKISERTKHIIVDSEDEHIGLMVDAIGDVSAAREENLEPAPANLAGVKGRYFQGVLKTPEKLIGILDIKEVLRD